MKGSVVVCNMHSAEIVHDDCFSFACWFLYASASEIRLAIRVQNDLLHYQTSILTKADLS